MIRNLIDDNRPWAQLGLTIIVSFTLLLIFMIVGIAAAMPFWGTNVLSLIGSIDLNNPSTINLLKLFQIFQSIGLFVLPPFVLAWLFSPQSLSYLHLNKKLTVRNAIVLAGIMLASITVINYLATLNAMIKFPAALSGLEHFFQGKENEAKVLTDAFMNTNSLNGLLVNILMIGILPALGEELFFRGILQRIFTNWKKNAHFGIIFTAFIFSAVHMQFYGFFPRWLLGIFFGYLLLWSGSLWLPIFAHFVNNTMAVIAYFLINKKMVNSNLADIGSTNDLLPYTIFCAILCGIGIWWLYKSYKTPSRITD